MGVGDQCLYRFRSSGQPAQHRNRIGDLCSTDDHLICTTEVLSETSLGASLLGSVRVTLVLLDSGSSFGRYS